MRLRVFVRVCIVRATVAVLAVLLLAETSFKILERGLCPCEAMLRVREPVTQVVDFVRVVR